jgi:hypothetical protein
MVARMSDRRVIVDVQRAETRRPLLYHGTAMVIRVDSRPRRARRTTIIVVIVTFPLLGPHEHCLFCFPLSPTCRFRTTAGAKLTALEFVIA